MKEKALKLDREDNKDSISEWVANNIVKSSEKIIKRFQIDKVLELSDKDKILIAYLLAQRTLSLRIKDAQPMINFLSQRQSVLLRTPNILISPLNKMRRFSLDWLERVTAEFVEKNYGMEGGTDHVENLERAVSDLVGRSTITDPNTIDHRIVINRGVVEEWGKRWKPIVANNSPRSE